MELAIKNEKLVAHFEAERNSPQPPLPLKQPALKFKILIADSKKLEEHSCGKESIDSGNL